MISIIAILLFLLLQMVSLGQIGLPAAVCQPEAWMEFIPATVKETAAEDATVRGAESLEELRNCITEEALFTPEQVRCMSFEMLLSSVMTCDPENGLALLEGGDPAEIAAMLNERFPTVVGTQTVQYLILSEYSAPIEDELRQTTLYWFNQQKDSFIASYGETSYQQVVQEVEGYETFYLYDYMVTNADGTAKLDGIRQGRTDGLMIIQSNGRFFWAAMDLFSGTEG